MSFRDQITYRNGAYACMVIAGLWSILAGIHIALGSWPLAMLDVFVVVWNLWFARLFLRRDRELAADIRAEIFLGRARFVHGTLDGQTRLFPATTPAWPDDYQVIYTNERYVHEGNGVYVLDDIARENSGRP